MKTLYVTDLDGTLLNTHHTVSSKSIGIINDLVEKFICVLEEYKINPLVYAYVDGAAEWLKENAKCNTD